MRPVPADLVIAASGTGGALGGAGEYVVGAGLLGVLLAAAKLLFSGLRYKDREIVRYNRQLQWERDREHKRAEWERSRGDYYMARALDPDHPATWPEAPPAWTEPPPLDDPTDDDDGERKGILPWR